jgi:Mg-chelatase subunit ChlD
VPQTTQAHQQQPALQKHPQQGHTDLLRALTMRAHHGASGHIRHTAAISLQAQMTADRSPSCL